MLRALSAALAAVLVCGTVAPAESFRPSRTSVLERLYVTSDRDAIERHAVRERDGTTYVSTGDIDAEWLRDASASMEPYIGAATRDAHVRNVLHGVLAREARYILIDPYANAFSANYRVVERKFEIDSLLYPIWFAYRYWKRTGDASVFTPEVRRAFSRALGVLRDEQHHGERSRYSHPALARGGSGAPVRYTGMIWTAFRPSDDAARYGYNIPDNMFAAVVLRDLVEIERGPFRDARTGDVAETLASQVQTAVEQHAIVSLPGVGRIYAYEIDGLGRANLMDDANVPSLLSAPYIGYVGASDRIYQTTRRFALSGRNPYFYVGRVAQGVGSPHTPHGYVWPLSLVMQALTSSDRSEIDRVFGYIAASDVGDHRLHESFDASWPTSFTRDDFAWPNALYGELVRRERKTT